MRRAAGLALAMAGVALGLGCGEGEAPTIYVGQVGGEGATYAAVARQGDRLVAFFCNGDPTTESYPGWFKGTVADDGSFRLERDGWTVAGILDAAGVQGLLGEPAGDVSPWAATLPPASLAGLYASFHRDCTTAVIVLDPSPASDPRVRGAWWCEDDADEPVFQVTPLLPLTVTDGRLHVEIAFESGVKELEVAPLTDLPR